MLDASDFYRESHAKIYRAALALYAKGEPVDAITLVDELEERGELEDAGGRVRIHELAAARPRERQRRALRAHRARDGDAPRSDSGGRRDRPAGLGAAGRDHRPRRPRRAGRLRPLAGARLRASSAHIEELLKDSFERITALYEAGADVTGTPSGFRDLDRLTSGFQPGNLIIVAARPSMGKSGLGLCMAANLAVRAKSARSRSSRSRCRSRRSPSG